MWILLKDVLDECDCCFMSVDCPLNRDVVKYTDVKKRQVVRELMPIAIRLYDDDDELYYTGYMNEGPCVDEFEPLDWAKGYAGCTKLKYRDVKTGKWQML